MIQEIIDGLLGWVMNFILNVIMNFIVKPIFTLAYHLLISIVSYYFYQVAVVFLSVIDLISDLFRMLAGLAPGITFRGLTNAFGAGVASDDMLIQFVTSKEVLGMFVSMFTVGVFLSIVSTLVSSIKQEFNLQKANKKGEVLNKLLRAWFNLAFVPVIAIFGMFMGNLFLKVVDAATGGDSATISGRIFAASARGAFYNNYDIMKVYLTDPATCGVTGSVNAVINLMMEAINSLFGEDNDMEDSVSGSALNESILDQYVYIDKHNDSGMYRVYYNSDAVSEDFNATRINYILIYFSSIAVIKCLLQASFGLVSRLYKGVALFVIMPGVIGISPMDDGNAYKGWKKELSKQIIGAYGVVIAVNLYLELMGIFSNISVSYVPTNAPNAAGSVSFAGLTNAVFSSLLTDNGFATAILQIIFIVCGALMLDKFSATISSLIGADNIASVGKGLFGDTSKATSGAVKTGVKTGAAGLAFTYKSVSGSIKGVSALSDKMKNKANTKKSLMDAYKKKRIADLAPEREAYINKMMREQYGKKLPKNEKALQQIKDKWGKKFDNSHVISDDEAEKYADSTMKARADFEKSVKKEIRQRTGFLAGGSRSFAMREVLDNAMKEYDSAENKPTSLAGLSHKSSEGTEESKAINLMDNAEGKAADERKANMKVGVRLGKNAIKQLMPGAKMFDEVKSGIAGKRSELRGFSDTDQSIIENFEKALQEGAEEKAKKDYKSLTDTAEKEVFGPLLDNVYTGLENSKNMLKQKYREMCERAKVNMSLGIPTNDIIENFIEQNKLGIVSMKEKSLEQVLSEIEMDINVKYDLSKVKQEIERVKSQSTNKAMLAELKKMIASYAGAPMIVKELEKTLAQIKSGLGSK